MFKVLNAFGFGSLICQWVRTFYKAMKSTVAVDWQLSQWLLIKRGCRQSSFSKLSTAQKQTNNQFTYLLPVECLDAGGRKCFWFILWTEILANMIRQDINNEGISIGETDHKTLSIDGDHNIIWNHRPIFFLPFLLLLLLRKLGFVLNAGKTSTIG